MWKIQKMSLPSGVLLCSYPKEYGSMTRRTISLLSGFLGSWRLSVSLDPIYFPINSKFFGKAYNFFSLFLPIFLDSGHFFVSLETYNFELLHQAHFCEQNSPQVYLLFLISSITYPYFTFFKFSKISFLQFSRLRLVFDKELLEYLVSH